MVGYNFLSIDSSGIYSNKFVRTSGYKDSEKLNPNSIWIGEGQFGKLTPEKFKEYLKKLGGMYIDEDGKVEVFQGSEECRIDDGELGLFIAYSNMGLKTHK